MPDHGHTRDVVETIRYTWSIGQQFREERRGHGEEGGVEISKEKSRKESIRGGQTAGNSSVWCLAALEKEDLSQQTVHCEPNPSPDGADTLTENA